MAVGTSIDVVEVFCMIGAARAARTVAFLSFVEFSVCGPETMHEFDGGLALGVAGA